MKCHTDRTINKSWSIMLLLTNIQKNPGKDLRHTTMPDTK